MKEYDRADAGFYDCWETGLEGDVEFYVEEAQKGGSPVLELGCGTGRILIPVAKAGVRIVGLDLAPSMLAVARRKVSRLGQEVKERIELVEGDMRDFQLRRSFKLVMIPYRAFLHLLTPEDQRAALGCIWQHLEDHGLLILNVFDPRLDMIVADSGSNASAMRKIGEFTHPETTNHVIVWNSRHYDPESQITRQQNIFEEIDAEGKAASRFWAPLTLRWVYRYEMQYLLELCSFRTEALYGDFKRGPFRYGGEQVWVARKRASNFAQGG